MNAWERNAGKYDRPSSSPIADAFKSSAPVVKGVMGGRKSKATVAKEALEAYHGIEPVGRCK